MTSVTWRKIRRPVCTGNLSVYNAENPGESITINLLDLEAGPSCLKCPRCSIDQTYSISLYTSWVSWQSSTLSSLYARNLCYLRGWFEGRRTLQRQFRLYIPFLGLARPQPQFPNSCVFERFTYIFPGSVYIFPPAEQADPSWEYIIRSQTHECGNWDLGPDIPFLGIFVSNFRHFVFAV